MESKEQADFKNICHAAGVKFTQQRMIIYRELANNPNHPDAEAVFKNVRSQLGNISLDTVYRTLWLFKDMGLITSLGPSRERMRFDPNLTPHHHFICTECGLISDINSEAVDTSDIQASVKSIGNIGRLQINIHGVCHECERTDKFTSNPTEQGGKL